MKKILIVFLCVLTTDTYADWFNKKLSFYWCSNELEVASCSIGCEKSTGDKIEFLVDKKMEM